MILEAFDIKTVDCFKYELRRILSNSSFIEELEERLYLGYSLKPQDFCINWKGDYRCLVVFNHPYGKKRIVIEEEHIETFE